LREQSWCKQIGEVCQCHQVFDNPLGVTIQYNPLTSEGDYSGSRCNSQLFLVFFPPRLFTVYTRLFRGVGYAFIYWANYMINLFSQPMTQIAVKFECN